MTLSFLQIAGALPFSLFSGGNNSSRRISNKKKSRRNNKKTRYNKNTNRITNRRNNRKTNRITNRRNNTRNNRKTNRKNNRKTNRRTNRKTNRKTNRRTNRRTNNIIRHRNISKRKFKSINNSSNYLCINGCSKHKKGYFTGNEPSPKGLGYCAKCTKLGTIMEGKDGNIWKVKKFSNSKRWIKLKSNMNGGYIRAGTF
tara:strand:- start:214 stop:810 length:597 start_codon:yes stop_codon:yes gene_type:complete